MTSILANAIKESIVSSLDDHVGISFSGGLDSTLIAKVASEHVDVMLYTTGTEESEDVKFAEKISEKLGLPLTKIIVSEEEAIRAYEECKGMFPALDFVKLDVLAPTYIVAKKAKEKGEKVLLFGSGAEELFVGYERYYTYYKEGKDLDSILREEFRTLIKRDIGFIKKLCYKFSIEARFPFYNERIAKLVFDIPIEDRMAERELKKGILREVAAMLGVPKEVIYRKKKAFQYGSGIHKILLKYKRKYESEASSLSM